MLLPLWILLTYSAISNADSDSDESVEKHQHSSDSLSGYPQQGNWHQHSSTLQPNKPKYGWYIEPVVGGGSPQGHFGSPFGQQQPFPAQYTPPNGYQGQQPTSGYGFPPTGRYNPNVPFSHQSQPNGYQGYHPGYGPIGQQRTSGYYPHTANYHHHHPAHFGQQPPFPYGGQQPVAGYNPNPFGQQSPPTSFVQQPNISNGGQQPGFGGQTGNIASSTGQQSPSTNGAPGLQSATGGYGPNALVQHPSTGQSAGTPIGIQLAMGGYGPDAINPPTP